MAVEPSVIALHSDFTGASESVFPSGWEAGLFSSEERWQRDGSGNAAPSAASWRCMATTGSFVRSATASGIIVEWSVIPDTAKVNMIYLVNDKTLDSCDGYAFRWQRDNDFQVQRWTAGAGTYLDGANQSTVVGTIAAGFQMAFMMDNAGITGYCSTDGGSTWQEMGTYAETTHTGTMYGAVEADATSTAIPKVTNVWFGLNGSGAPPTIEAGAIASAFTGTTVAPTIPTHAVGDPIIVVASKNDAATLSLSGWTAIGTPENNANLSTGAWYKIATSTSETASVSSSTSASLTAGLYAQAFVVDGSIYESLEDATWNGSPTTSTTPAGATITTTVANAIAFTVALLDSLGSFASGLPPSGWTTLSDVSIGGPDVPTITWASIVASVDASAPYTVTGTLPTHAADDILIACACYNAGSTLTCGTSGWAAIATGQNSANFSTAWFWKRATSSAETAPVITSNVAGSTSNGIYVTCAKISGCVTTGTPFEDATLNGTPTLSTTPGSSLITTTGPQRLAVAIALMDDNNAITNYPPATWTGNANTSSATGGDSTTVAISKAVAVAGDVAAVNTNTQAASDYWKTLTLAFIPKDKASGRITSITKEQAATGDVTGATVGTLSAAAYWKTLSLALIPPVAATSRLKRWNGSSWVVATLKQGASWTVKPVKKF